MNSSFAAQPPVITAQVKICGITTLDAIKAAANANFIGFIFYPVSPRNVTPVQAADLAAHTDIPSVAVTVDPTDALLENIFSAFTPDYIQLHGKESPLRVKDIKDRFGTRAIKALPIANAKDLDSAADYELFADMLLFDAKGTEAMPGGNGLPFDWSILSNRNFIKPWFLSGGLNANNVEEAMRISGAKMVDVSSSLESKPGLKDPELVKAFVQKVKHILV